MDKLKALVLPSQSRFEMVRNPFTQSKKQQCITSIDQLESEECIKLPLIK